MNCSLPDFSVHGILQARILESVAIPFSKDLPDPGLGLGLLLCSQILYSLNHQEVLFPYYINVSSVPSSISSQCSSPLLSLLGSLGYPAHSWYLKF